MTWYNQHLLLIVLLSEEKVYGNLFFLAKSVWYEHDNDMVKTTLTHTNFLEKESTMTKIVPILTFLWQKCMVRTL